MTAKERYGAGRIVVSDYDPAWSAMFERERARVQEALGVIVVTVEHVGSTAVPGLAAKPIIDLLVGVRSLPEARTCCVEPMQALRHLMEPTCPRWEEFTLVRDYLRRHPEVASAYADLKRALALVFEDDIAGYRTAKAPFIEAVIARARAER
jgi:GrpB-like predicted nucleotidyltransferase (UPF0157 family)